ncbi:MAG: hydroxymethylbilane synthase [Planctomycetota bacterium]
MRVLRLATRQSRLALAQSRKVAKAIEQAHPDVRVELVGLTTQGDRDQGDLTRHGGKGLFVTEVEQALLRCEADLAVHSLKDVPVTMPLTDGVEELVAAAIPTREDVRDVLILRPGLDTLPVDARLGTSSPRRAMLMRHDRPDLRIVPFRGNVDTRLEKLRTGEVDATLLAAAGLRRLGLLDDASDELSGLRLRILPPDDHPPAAGQGALLVQCRRDEVDVRDLVRPLDDPATRRAVAVERRVVELLDGDCHSPIAAYAEPLDAERVRLTAAWARGEEVIQRTVVASDAVAANEALRS